MKPQIDEISWQTKRGKSAAFKVWYWDKGGRRRTKNFLIGSRKHRTRTDAKKAADKFAAKQYYEPEEISSNDKLAKIADAWLETAEKSGLGNRAPIDSSTYRGYKNHVEKWIKPLIGGLKMSEIDSAKCWIYRDDLGKKAKAPTAKAAFASFRSIMKFADQRGYIAEDPTSEAMNFSVGKGRHKKEKEAKIPSQDDVRALLAAADRMASGKQPVIRGRGEFQIEQRRQAWIKYRPAVQILYELGLRMSELRGLPWRCVNLKNLTVTIKQRAEEDGTIGPCKSEKAYRDLPITRECGEMLRALKDYQGAGRKFVLGTENDVPERHANFVNRCWKHLMKEANLSKITRHALRHFRASLLIADGRSVIYVQEWLGHEDPETTLGVYGHLFKEREDRAAERHADLHRRFMAGEEIGG